MNASIQYLFGAEVAALQDADKRRNVSESDERPGCFKSEPLCSWQVKQANAGFCAAELVKSCFGWGLRYASGLDGFAVIAGVRDGQLDGSYDAALAYASKWFSHSPEKRCVFVRSHYLTE